MKRYRVFGDRFDQMSLDGRPNRRKKISVFKQQTARMGEARKVREDFDFSLGKYGFE